MIDAVPQLTARVDFVSAGSPLPEKNLRAIRAALVVPEDREAFDAGLKAVLDEVRVSVDLAALNAFVHRWWISACDTAKDPEGAVRCTSEPSSLWPANLFPRGSRGGRSLLLVDRCLGVQAHRRSRSRGTDRCATRSCSSPKCRPGRHMSNRAVRPGAASPLSIPCSPPPCSSRPQG